MRCAHYVDPCIDMHNTRMHVLADADDLIPTPSVPTSGALVSITSGGTQPAATTDAPPADDG